MLRFMKIFDRSLWGITLFTLTYLIGGIAVSLAKTNWEFLFYVTVLIVIVVAVVTIHSRIRFTQGVLWCLSLWGLFHLLGGLLPVPASWPVETDRYVLYNVWVFPWLKFDQLLHGYGFAVATWACYQALRALLPAATPRFGLLLICVFAGMGLGAFNEVMEFTVTLFLHENNVGGYENTGWDLVSNMVGSVAAALLIHYGSPAEIRRPPRPAIV
jgi:hypothetical protein